MANHSDISFSVGACARYQANPKESQLTCVKRIIRYISGTLYYGPPSYLPQREEGNYYVWIVQ